MHANIMPKVDEVSIDALDSTLRDLNGYRPHCADGLGRLWRGIKMIPQDYHLHSNFSCDSQASMHSLCRQAVARGIEEVGFCEHFDLIPQGPCFGFFRVEQWWKELERCRQTFRETLIIRAGIEIGEPHRFPHQVQSMLDDHPWDYVIGSLHWVGDRLIFDQDYYSRPEAEAYRDYFRELANLVNEGNFDILAHADIVKRYGFDHYQHYDPRQFENQIRSLLKACALRGIALEINTSTLRQPIGEICPHQFFFEWYRQEGGFRVVLGSDAHASEEIAFGFDIASRSLHASGYNAVTAFYRRKASYIKLPALE